MEQNRSRAHGRVHLLTVAVAICAVATTVAACGSSDVSSTSSASAGTSSTAASSTGGGTKATGKPITVGFLSPDLGPTAIASSGWGEQAAVKRLNDQLNGVNGRPLDVKVCHTDATPENNISCANQLVRDHVVAVIDGMDLGTNAALPIFKSAKIPVVGNTAFTSEGESDSNSYYFGPSQAVYAIGPLQSFKQQNLKSIVFAGADIPASHGYLEGFVGPAAEQQGLTFKPVYYPPANPNFATVASTIVALNPDIGGASGMADEGQCTTFIQDLRTAGYKGTGFAGLCTAFIKTLGAEAGDVEVYSDVWNPQMAKYTPASEQSDLAMMTADLKTVGDPSKQGYFTYGTYSAVMTFADVLKTVQGEYSGPSITAALRATKDMPSFLGPKITCDHSVWPNSSACSDELIVAKTTGDGGLQPLDGGFQKVSPSLLPQKK